MPYEKFLQDRLFTPLGMTDTTFFPSSSQMERLAKSYAEWASGDPKNEFTAEAVKVFAVGK